MRVNTISEKPLPTRVKSGRILILVEDPGTAELLATSLELAGHQVVTTDAVMGAVALLSEQRFDLAVVDVKLPEIRDFAGYPRLATSERPPVLFLTSCESLGNLVPKLVGASDYVTKPVRIAEVLARTQVLLRDRCPRPGDRSQRYGDLVLDDVTCQARRGRRELDLSPAEYRLLRYLVVNAEQVFSKRQIGRHVWGESRPDNAIEKLVSRLRYKVDQEEPALVHTRRGFGYWLGR